MKYKNKIYLLVAFLVFSACEIKWDMNVVFNEDFSGKYSIKLLINEELQLYALDTVSYTHLTLPTNREV